MLVSSVMRSRLRATCILYVGEVTISAKKQSDGMKYGNSHVAITLPSIPPPLLPLPYEGK